VSAEAFLHEIHEVAGLRQSAKQTLRVRALRSFFSHSTTTDVIQRIQTVYLLLGTLALAALGLFDLPWTSQAAAVHGWFVPVLVGLIVVTAGTALWAIFLYDRRKRQRSVVVSVQVATVLLAGTLYGGLYLTSELAFRGSGGVDWGKAAMLGLPILAYLFFFLARRGIDHDIELVESMDRLR
jgi:hypothetical protein